MNLGRAKVLDRLGGALLARIIGALDRVIGFWRTPRPVEQVDRILLIKFWGLGNWALLRPLVRELGRAHPGARLTIVTLAGNEALCADLDAELKLVRTSGFLRIVLDLLGIARWLRKQPHDLSIDFEQFSQTGALLARAGGIPQRIGYRGRSAARTGLYTVAVPFRGDVHAREAFLDLIVSAGGRRLPFAPGDLPLDEARRTRWQGTQPLVVLHPGSGDNFPGRRWSPAGFAALARHAHAQGARVVLTGVDGEGALTAEVARRSGGVAQDLAGQLTLPDLFALLAEADVLVSNDTGPVHFASQLGRPVIGIFGPNTPVRYGPLSAGSRVFYRDLPCSPCLTNRNYRSSSCRIFTCMNTIATGHVIAALDQVLAQARSVRA